MKFNIKNVPTGDGMDCPEFSVAINDWFEGFEKELRQQYIQLIDLAHKDEGIPVSIGNNQINFTQSERWSILVKIKEILGDET